VANDEKQLGRAQAVAGVYTVIAVYALVVTVTLMTAFNAG
jgi:hypothetical protein